MAFSFRRTLIPMTSQSPTESGRAAKQRFAAEYPARRTPPSSIRSLYLAVGAAYLEHLVRPTTDIQDLHNFISWLTQTQSFLTELRFNMDHLLEKLGLLISKAGSSRSVALTFLNLELTRKTFVVCVETLMMNIAVLYCSYFPDTEEHRAYKAELIAARKNILNGCKTGSVEERILADALNVSLEVHQWSEPNARMHTTFVLPLKTGLFPRLTLFKTEGYAVLYSTEVMDVEACTIQPNVEFFEMPWTQAELARLKAKLHVELPLSAAEEARMASMQLPSAAAREAPNEPAIRVNISEERKEPIQVSEAHPKSMEVETSTAAQLQAKQVESDEDEFFDSIGEPQKLPSRKLPSNLTEDLLGCLLSFLNAAKSGLPTPSAMLALKSEIREVLQGKELSVSQRKLLEAVKTKPEASVDKQLAEFQLSPRCTACSGALSTLQTRHSEFCNHLCVNCVITGFKSYNTTCPSCSMSYSCVQSTAALLRKKCLRCNSSYTRLSNFNLSHDLCDSCVRVGSMA
jgi:hypothetical protein